MSDENKKLTPVWIVYVDGKRLDTKHEGALKKIVINDKLNGVGTFSLLFDISAEKLPELGSFSLESQISIHLGYKDDIAEVFDGEITAFAGHFEEFGHETVEVRGCNASYKLKHGNHFISYENKTFSEAIKGIIENYSLRAEIDSFGACRIFESIKGVSDYDFLMWAAERYGKDVYAYGNKVYVKDSIEFESSEVIFEWGKSLISFYPVKDISELYSDCRCIGWDSLKCESFIGNANVNDVAKKIGGSNAWLSCSKCGSGKWIDNIVDNSFVDEDDAKNVALGRLQHNSYKFMTAKGKAEGTYTLFPGMIVSIKYVGDTFSGDYITDSVTHEFDNANGYTTSFTLKRNMC